MSEEKQKQIEALGRLGWSLRRIEQATGVRRETASAYLKAASIAVRPPGQWGRARPAIIQTPPGHEGQVDYGEGPMVRDGHIGKYRRTRLFILTPGCSRKSVRLLAWRSSSKVWAELHEQAFRRLGGAPRIIVLDNLRDSVLKPDTYDAELNPLYADVLQHYGAVAMPCRVRDPDRKGKVESAIGHTQRTPLKGQRFETLEEAQAYLDRWDRQWADTRIHGTTKRQLPRCSRRKGSRCCRCQSSLSAITSTADLTCR